jgi:hypothetical protein
MEQVGRSVHGCERGGMPQVDMVEHNVELDWTINNICRYILDDLYLSSSVGFVCKTVGCENMTVAIASGVVFVIFLILPRYLK